ncbi:coniferyl aldehyde dehydrogenase [Psychrobacter sp. I-STPA6b]|uniref:coniferyl aldehyde dehydrogenase n=1 Tax=Psychrobacter sp. I-STPA6b TaxID=2585718 RepID=UPI001D0C98C6|nr:coniferyl aldehyde dehydrogenase [Psychrobacter sp. I-STPA6b]
MSESLYGSQFQVKAIITNQEQLQAQFQAMSKLSRQTPILTWTQRLSHLEALEQMLKECQSQFAQAISQDFNHRSVDETNFAELFPSFQAIAYAKKHGQSWMKTRRVGISALYLPAHNEIHPQPLGVVGIIVPWNYPLYLAVAPMIDALTAGNRIMIKMSETAPNFAQCFAEAVASYFSADVVSVVLGEVEVAKAFSELPFDHLLYTGSTEVGKKVMAAAAPNLTPVTLELGGKSPVVVLDDADIETVVNRVMMGKTLNAGQTCIAPDYVLLPRQYHQQFITLAKQWMQKHYPNLAHNEDYTHLISDEQFNRVQGYLEALDTDKVYPLTEVDAHSKSRLFPPVIVTEPALDSTLMQEEIFAPILPLIHYDSISEVVHFINQRPRPLALYLFGSDEDNLRYVMDYTVSGGVAVNEVILHVAQHELPFGGVGDSGIGAYHGQTGFERFSHMKPVFVQSRLNAMNLLLPPYGKLFKKGIDWLIK